MALLLTSVMIMETPMQGFAAEKTAVTSEAADASQDRMAGRSGGLSGEGQQDAGAQPGTGDTAAGADPAANDKVKTEGAGTTAAGNAVSDGQHGDGSQQDDEKKRQDSEGQDGPQQAGGEQGTVQDAEETTVDWSIQASQFGEPPLADYDGITTDSAYNTTLALIKDALTDKTMKTTSEQTITEEVLKKTIVYLFEKGSADTSKVLPEVAYTLKNGRVTSVKFNYIAEDSMKVTLDGPVWDGDHVVLKYVMPSNITTIKIHRIPVKEDGTYSWDGYKDITADRNNGYTDENPTPGDYAYIVFGLDNQGTVITYSDMRICKYELPQVSNFKVASTDRTGTTFTWDVLDAAEGYVLSRDGEELTTVTDKNTTSFKDGTAPADGNFTYELKAYRQRPEEEGRWESTVTVEAASAKTSALSRPSIAFTSPSSDQAALNWSGNAEGYELYKVHNGSYEKVTEVSGTSYQLTGLEVGQIYSYAVCPYKTNNGFRVYGEMSDTVDVTTSLSGSSIQASAAAYNQINLSWTQTAQADGYEIYRNGQILQTVWGGNNCFYADTAIACGTAYSYQVRPFKNTGGTTSYGAFSGEASAVTSLPGTSMQGVDSREYQALTITWNQGAGASGYELYRSNTSGTNYSLLADIADGNTTSYRDTAVTVGETWFYKVKPYRVENGQKVYGPETGEVSGLVTLGSVSGVNAWASAYNRIELTWNKLPYATGYEIYYSTSPDSGYQFLKRVGKGASRFKWSRALCGTTYYFQIRPIQKVKKVINYGTFSDTVSAMTTVGTPSPTVSKVTYDRMTLKWKGIKGAKGYNIYVADSENGSYQYFMTTRRTSNVLKKLEAGRTYYFKVTAFRDNYESPLSGMVSGRPSIGNVTKLKVVTKSGTELKLTWKSVKGAEKYVILRADSQDGVYTQAGETKKNSYMDGGLANSTTYFYKVYAVRGNCASDQAGPVNARTKDAGSVNTNEDKKNIYRGIDVSSYQGSINWDAVEKDGIDFAMIRILTGRDASAMNYDSRFEANYSGARAAGLDVGVYRYSYATSRTLARKEAKAVIRALEGRKLDYPIVMDFESSVILQGTSTNARRAEIILAFKEEVENAGYKFALYANKNWLDNYIDTGMLGDTHIWLARWRSLESGHGYTGRGTVTMWQYTDKGSVRGISGNVDMNVSYKKYR